MKWLQSKNFTFPRKLIEEKILSALPDLEDSSKAFEVLNWDNFFPVVFEVLENESELQQPFKSMNKTRKNNSKATNLFTKSEKDVAKGSAKVCRRTVSAHENGGILCNCCALSQEEFEQAVEAVTKGLAYAVPDTIEMSLGYKLRARYLYNLHYYEECLEDLGRIQLDKLEPIVQLEVEMLRSSSLSALVEWSMKQSKLFLHKLPMNDACLLSLNKKLKKYPPKEIIKTVFESIACNEIKCPNEKFPCASEAIEVKYSEGFGRHIVATRDIDVGELLIVEEPHDQTLFLKNCFTHCWHCFKGIWNGIPCDSCVNIIYCSEHCKNTDWTTLHHLECTLIDLLQKYEKDLGNLQGQTFRLRTMLQAVYNAGGLTDLRERVEKLKTEKSPDWIINEGLDTSESLSLESIFAFASLESNKLNFNLETFIDSGIAVVRKIYLLATNTDFFGMRYDRKKISDAKIISDLSKNPDVLFFANILLKLKFYSETNYFEIREFDVSQFHIRGFASYPFCALFNHGCFPNTIKVHERNKLALYSSLPIKKGEQVTVNYASCSDLKPEEYRFDCHCTLCKNNLTLAEVKSYKDLVNSESWKIKVDETLTKFLEVQEKIYQKQYEDKDEVLQEAVDLLKVVYEGVDGFPCRVVERMIKTISFVYNRRGNLSKNHKIHSNLCWYDDDSIFDL